MLNIKKAKKNLIKVLLSSTIFVGTSFSVNYQTKAFAANTEINLTIPLGQVAPFQVPEGITTLVIGDPTIAEVVIPPGQNKTALVNTKAAGLTNILVWTEKGGPPNNILLEVQNTKRSEQISTKVRVLEVTDGDDGALGIKWQDYLSFTESPASAPFKFGLPVRTANLEAKIDTLVNERRGKLLAQPTLISLDGKEAKFLSGGEYPVVFYERDRVNIQWKEYGIKLELTAKIEGTDNILVTLKPEVSSIDRANSVTLVATQSTGSAVIPAFITRKAETTLNIRDNETIVIAGLLNNDQQYVDRKIPFLGDIPVVGFLFKSREFKNIRTELVFLVTPSILKNAIVNPEKNYAGEAAKLEKK
ncbi:MAG: pilus assembly protein N-terminal domain-containing protein [Candidatus Sericytochromatia bacterium]|nr:pilus assembly protein N-terminal domain-containing protein [Candidatus Sericytochromatia bacterium]